MSKFYDKYLELKKEDQEKMYLFRCGNFYIFLDEDANKINDYVVLKKTKFTNEIEKCGFPVASLENYLKVFQNHKLPIEVVEEIIILGKEAKLEKILKKFLLGSIINESILPLDSFILTSMIFPIFLPSKILTIFLFCKSDNRIKITYLIIFKKKRKKTFLTIKNCIPVFFCYIIGLV